VIPTFAFEQVETSPEIFAESLTKRESLMKKFPFAEASDPKLIVPATDKNFAKLALSDTLRMLPIWTLAWAER
jgi:hypothetical protein